MAKTKLYQNMAKNFLNFHGFKFLIQVRIKLGFPKDPDQTNLTDYDYIIQG